MSEGRSSCFASNCVDDDRNTVDSVLASNEGKAVNVLIDSLGGSLATGLSISAATDPKPLSPAPKGRFCYASGKPMTQEGSISV